MPRALRNPPLFPNISYTISLQSSTQAVFGLISPHSSTTTFCALISPHSNIVALLSSTFHPNILCHNINPTLHPNILCPYIISPHFLPSDDFTAVPHNFVSLYHSTLHPNILCSNITDPNIHVPYFHPISLPQQVLFLFLERLGKPCFSFLCTSYV